MPSATTRTDRETVILSESRKSERQSQTSSDTTPVCNPIKKMKHMNSSSAKTETDIQIPKANSWLPKGKHGRGRGGGW